MKIINQILKNPFLWQISQKIFGDDNEKMILYKSVIKKRGKLLDFGCANGNTFPIFSDYEYYGYDTDGLMILDARKKFKSYKNAHFYKIDILKNKSPEKGFDLILFALTGHHIPDDKLIMIFSKLTQIAEKGARIFYFDSIRTSNDSPLLKLILNMDQGKHIRTLNEYKKIKSKLSKKLKVIKERTYQIKNTLMPQPKYIYWELKINK